MDSPDDQKHDVLPTAPQEPEPGTQSKSSEDETEPSPIQESKRSRIPRVPFNMGVNGELTQDRLMKGYTVNWQGYGVQGVSGNEQVRVEKLYTPTSYRDAVTCQDAEEWKESIQKEYDNFWKSGAKVVKRPVGKNVIRSLLLFKNKQRADGTLEKRKTRLCARGDTQKLGVDYDQTYAPTVHASTLKMFLHLVVQYGMKVLQFDVPSAFLRAPLDTIVYMEPPPGMNVPKGFVLLLTRAVYGLVQSPRLFYREFASFLESIGFTRCVLDGCLFCRVKNGNKQFLAIHVDDGLIASSDSAVTREVVEALRSKWGVEDFGALGYYLGFQLKQSANRRELKVSSRSYIETLLERFSMTDVKPVHTPMVPGVCLASDPPTEDILDPKVYPYRQLMGSLQYLSCNSRPDISFAVGVLSRSLAKPTLQHWRSAKRILAYLGTTRNLGIVFCKQSGNVNKVHVTTDADYASHETRHSTYGYVTRLGTNLISWKSKLNRSKIALSSCESELKGMIEGAKDAIYVRNVLIELKEPVESKYQISSDNQPALKLCKNPVYHGRIKHLDVSQHFLRFEFDNGAVDLSYVPTKENIADMLTKALPRPQFEKLRALIMC